MYSIVRLSDVGDPGCKRNQEGYKARNIGNLDANISTRINLHSRVAEEQGLAAKNIGNLQIPARDISQEIPCVRKKLIKTSSTEKI